MQNPQALSRSHIARSFKGALTMRVSASRRQAGGVRVASASLYTAPSIPLRHFTTQKQSKFLYFFLHFYYNNLFVIAIRKPRQPLCSSLALPHATRPLRAPLSHCPFLGELGFCYIFYIWVFCRRRHTRQALVTDRRPLTVFAFREASVSNSRFPKSHLRSQELQFF